MTIKRNHLLFALKTGLAIFTTFVISYFPLHTLEFFTYDLRFRLNPFTKISQDIVTIPIDQDTLQRFNGEPDIRAHTQLLNQLLDHDPLVVYYAIDPQGLRGSSRDQQEFTKTLLKFRNNIIYIKALPNKGEDHKLNLGPNFKGLKYTPGYLSTDFQHYAEDSVARRAVLYDQGYVYSQVITANLKRPVSNLLDYRGAYQFKTSRQVFVNYQRTGAINSIPFDVVYEKLNNDIDLKDKIVLIGSDTKFDYTQYVKTVYNNANFAMPEVEAQANIINTLILDNGIIRTPELLNFFLTLILCLIAVFSIFSFAPLKATLIIFATATTFFLSCYLIFIFSNIAVEMAHPLLGLFLLQYALFPFMVVKLARQNDANLLRAKEEKDKAINKAKVTAKSAKADLGFRIATQLAHDIRSPVMALETVRSIARSEMRAETLKLLENSITRINNIADSLLKKFKSGSFETINESSSTEIVGLIEGLIDTYQKIYPEVKIQFITSSSKILIPLDGVDIERALTNVLNNAIEAMSFKGQISIKLEDNTVFAQIHIKDSGKGIPTDLQTKIFDRGFTHGKESGTGLGLAQTKDALSRSGGDAILESSKPGETIFRLVLAKSNLETLEIDCSKNVIIVEDVPETMDVWKKILGEMGIKMVGFKSYHDFKTSMEKDNFNPFNNQKFTLITDLILENEDETGFEVLQICQAHGSRYLYNSYLCTSLSSNEEILGIAKDLGTTVFGKKDLDRLKIRITLP